MQIFDKEGMLAITLRSMRTYQIRFFFIKEEFEVKKMKHNFDDDNVKTFRSPPTIKEF